MNILITEFTSVDFISVPNLHTNSNIALESPMSLYRLQQQKNPYEKFKRSILHNMRLPGSIKTNGRPCDTSCLYSNSKSSMKKHFTFFCCILVYIRAA